MTETEQDLARQLAAHPEWQWMNGIRLLYVGPPRLGFDARRVDVGDRKEPREGWIPDLADPATQGCLLHMLREAWEAVPFEQDMAIEGMWGLDDGTERWNVAPGTGHLIGHSPWVGYGETFGEALARAWLATKGEDAKP